jgi:hypothetical protein
MFEVYFWWSHNIVTLDKPHVYHIKCGMWRYSLTYTHNLGSTHTQNHYSICASIL